MSTIKFTVATVPVAFKRTLANGKRRFNDPRYSDFKEIIGLHARRAMQGQAPLTDAVKLSVVISTKFKPTSLRAGDIDNHLKAVLDALNGVCYADDRQVIFVQAEKIFGEPHITIEVEEITQ